MAEAIADRVRAVLDLVVDELSFISFLRVLSEDWELERQQERERAGAPYGSGSRGWENGTVGAFLEGACDWAEASRFGLPAYMPSANVWRRCAEIVYMGKSYE